MSLIILKFGAAQWVSPGSIMGYGLPKFVRAKIRRRTGIPISDVGNNDPSVDRSRARLEGQVYRGSRSRRWEERIRPN
jgi:hypothetical protein